MGLYFDKSCPRTEGKINMLIPENSSSHVANGGEGEPNPNASVVDVDSWLLMPSSRPIRDVPVDLPIVDVRPGGMG